MKYNHTTKENVKRFKGIMVNKRDNFKRISENRVSKILLLLNQMKNLTNSSFYEYTNEEVDKIFSTIKKESDSTKKILLKAKAENKGTMRFEL